MQCFWQKLNHPTILGTAEVLHSFTLVFNYGFEFKSIFNI